jgi:DNA-binding response OmpR family regulator
MIYNQSKVLVVDDERAICELVSESLSLDGYTCDIALTAKEALMKLQETDFEITLLDIKLPDESGIDLLKKVQILSQNTKFIMMTANKELDTTVSAMKLGATDHIVKPFTIEKLEKAIAVALVSSKRNNCVYEAIPHVDLEIGGSIDSDSLTALNGIAYGVDARIDYFDFHSKLVTKRTIAVAQDLELPSKDIENWAAVRKRIEYQRRKYIQSAINKLERSALAQLVLGLTKSVYKYL